MFNFEFTNPWFLLLLLLIPLVMLWHLAFKNQVIVPMKTPAIGAFGETKDWYRYINPFLFLLRMTALTLLIVAFARPRKVDVSTHVRSDEGVDIMMVVDVSLSMLARDLKPTRLAALQEVAEEFVTKRPTDRIGLIEYSGEAVTKVPLTTDRGILVNQIRNLKNGKHIESGTAIGIGLATAINHLQHSKAKSKVVLLITDGGESPVDYSRNKVYISPEDAAEIAAEKGIKVYTIGIGSKGYILPPKDYEPQKGEDPQKTFRLDEDLLKYISKKVDGLYFRASDNQKLEEIYNEINQLEKTEINEIKYYNYTEYYPRFIILGLFVLLIDIILRTLVFRQLT